MLVNSYLGHMTFYTFSNHNKATDAREELPGRAAIENFQGAVVRPPQQPGSEIRRTHLGEHEGSFFWSL